MGKTGLLPIKLSRKPQATGTPGSLASRRKTAQELA